MNSAIWFTYFSFLGIFDRTPDPIWHRTHRDWAPMNTGRMRSSNCSTRNIPGISLLWKIAHLQMSHLSTTALSDGYIRLPEETIERGIGKSRQTVIFEESSFVMFCLSLSRLCFDGITSLKLPVWRIYVSMGVRIPKGKMTSGSSRKPVKSIVKVMYKL